MAVTNQRNDLSVGNLAVTGSLVVGNDAVIDDALTVTGALTAGATTVTTLGTAGAVTLADGNNVVVGTTTGTKIGTATSQKLGFFNAAPVVQQAAVADAAGGAIIDAEARTALNALLARLHTLGLIAT